MRLEGGTCRRKKSPKIVSDIQCIYPNTFTILDQFKTSYLGSSVRRLCFGGMQKRAAVPADTDQQHLHVGSISKRPERRVRAGAPRKWMR